MVVSLGAMLYVFLATSIAWTWFVFLGSLITFGVAWAASFVIGPIGQIGPIEEEKI
jgi:hypothetical protein